MKQTFMKKALAVVLSTAMTFSLSSMQIQTASAAKKFVSLNTTFKTLKVGQKYSLKLKNNTSKWKVKKAVSTDKAIANVYAKSTSNVKIKGKSAGRATIRVNVETAARKTNNKKTLRCRIKVVEAGAATPTPSPTPSPAPSTPDPAKTSAQVSTQAELDAALNNKAVTSITISTTAASSFNIPAGMYSSVDLTVNAPNADVVNNANFKSVTIKAIKADTWTEKAKGNTLKVDAAKARIVVDEAATVAGISVAYANADVTIVVNGTASGITVNAKAKVSILGTAKTKVPVSIAAAAADSVLSSVIPVTIQAAANATIDLGAGAEESTVEVTNNAATVTVKNNTTKKITVTKADKSKTEVSVKGSTTVKPSTSSTGGSNWGGGSSWSGVGSGSGSSGGSYVPTSKTVSNQADLDAALKNTSLRTITIKDAVGDLNIGDGSYSNIDLIVDAKDASVNNYATFKSIEIRNIKSETWHEFGKRNKFNIKAPKPNIIVDKDAVVEELKFTAEKQLATLTINGTVNSEILCQGSKEAGVTVTLGSTAKIEKGLKVTAMVVKLLGQITENLKVTLTTAEAQLDSEVPVSISMEKEASEAKIWLGEGAEGSTLDYAEEGMKVQINTDVEVKTTVAGKATTAGDGKIDAGTNGTVDAATNEEVDGSEKLPDEGATLPEAPAEGDDNTGSGDDNTGSGDDNTGSGDDNTGGNETPTGTPSIMLEAAQVTTTTGSSVVVVTASAFRLGDTAVSGATFAERATCGDKESDTANNGVYTFASGTTGTLTFTVTANSITYTVTAEITGLEETAKEVTATVTAPSGSETSGS